MAPLACVQIMLIQAGSVYYTPLHALPPTPAAMMTPS